MRYVLEIIRDEVIDRSLHNCIELEHFDDRTIVPRCSTIVCHGDPLVKQRVHEELAELEVPIAMAAVHHRAVLSSSAHVGAGSIVNATAYLAQCVELGAGVMVHAGVVVEHDSAVHNFANLAPGVTVCGGATIGECAAVYAGATIGPGVVIGAKARIYAGAVVLDDVPAGAAVRGIPARCEPS